VILVGFIIRTHSNKMYMYIYIEETEKPNTQKTEISVLRQISGHRDTYKTGI